MSAVRQIVGVIGSCRCSTSKRSRSSARTVLKYERGESTMFGSEPFAGTITERPTGITFAGGSPWRPTRGCSTRVNWPGGSFPITRRTSWPRSSSAAACSSACSTTAPQNDHENGTTIPIFTPQEPNGRLAKLGAMALDGIHHVTCITADAPRNVDFYTRVLGLRLVKKTVNQDDPTVYHLFYADEDGTPGSDITFFEYPGVRRGQRGAGMVHTVQWRVGSDAALDFWESRLSAEAAARRPRRRRA